MIYVIVNYIFIKLYFDLLIMLFQISKKWIKWFLDYKLKFYKKKQKLLIVKYKNIYNKDNFQEYFKKYKDICIIKRIADENI